MKPCSTLTPKMLRREIENELELEEGDLDSSELRNAVKEAIAATMVGRIVQSCLMCEFTRYMSDRSGFG